MATIPIITIKYSDNSDKPNNSSADTPPKMSDENYIITGLTAALCNENFNEESIKAAAILINNNYSVNPNYYDLTDKKIFIKALQKSLKSKNKDLLKLIKYEL